MVAESVRGSGRSGLRTAQRPEVELTDPSAWRLLRGVWTVVMEFESDIERLEIRVQAPDVEAAETLIRDAKAQGGFLVALAERPQPFATFRFLLQAPGGFELRFSARVVQVFDQPGAGLQAAFQLEGWDEGRDRELGRWAAGARRAGEGSAEGEVAGVSPIFRIKQMDPGARARLALKADRGERKILCRDTVPQILLNLLGNPRVEAGDVLRIVKSTYANAGLLQRVASDRRWTGNSEIVTAVVRNPKTPTPMAIRVLELVPTPELRKMAKLGALREDVRRAAFRVYTKRSSRRG